MKRKKYFRKKKNRRSTLLWISFFLSLVFFFVWYLNRPSLQIHSIQVLGNTSLSEDEITRFIENDLSQYWFGVIPHRSRVLFSPKRMEELIENHFLKIYDAEVKQKDSTIIISLEERKPYALWCRKEGEQRRGGSKEELLDINEECYFIDKRGFIYARSPYFSEGIFDKVYQEQDFQLGDQILTEKEFQSFFRFLQRLKEEHGADIDRILLSKRNIFIYFQKFFGVPLKQKPYLVFPHKLSYEMVLKELDIMKENELFQSDFPQKADKLIYIDLRIPLQIRYKIDDYEKQ